MYFISTIISTLLNIYVGTILVSGVVTAINSFTSNNRIINNGYNIKYPTQVSFLNNYKYYTKNYGRLLIPFSNIKNSFKNLHKNIWHPEVFDAERMSALNEVGRLEEPKPVTPMLKTIDQRRAEEKEKEAEKTSSPAPVVAKTKGPEDMTASEKMTYYTKEYKRVRALYDRCTDEAQKAKYCNLATIYCEGYKAARDEIKRMEALASLKATKDELADIPVLGRK